MSNTDNWDVWRLAKLAKNNGVSYTEIANELGCSRELVRQKVFKVIEKDDE